jgi:hypothetical protein
MGHTDSKHDTRYTRLTLLHVGVTDIGESRLVQVLFDNESVIGKGQDEEEALRNVLDEIGLMTLDIRRRLEKFKGS